MIRNLDFVFMIDQIFLSSYYKNNFLHKNAFQGPGFFRVQVFLGPGFSGSRFFMVRVQGPGPGFKTQVLSVNITKFVRTPF